MSIGPFTLNAYRAPVRNENSVIAFDYVAHVRVHSQTRVAARNVNGR